MKKIITTLVAGAMMFGFTAPTFAAINPANIDESSSRDNIYKIVWEDVSEGTNAGVVSIFAWAHIDGTIYSVALSQLRKHGNPSKAFAEIVGAQLAVDQAANLVGVLKDAVNVNNERIVEIREVERLVEVLVEVEVPTEVIVERIVEVMGPERIVEVERIVERIIDNTDNSEIERLTMANERLEGYIGTYVPDAALLDGVVIGPTDHQQFINRFVEFYNEHLMAGYGELPEESLRGLTGTLADIAVALHDEITAVEERLDEIHASIDTLGNLGWDSDLDWTTKTVLEKANLIAGKVPDLVENLKDVNLKLDAASAANVGFMPIMNAEGVITSYEVHLPTIAGAAFTDVLTELDDLGVPGLNLDSVTDAESLEMAIYTALSSAQTAERTTIIGHLNTIYGVNITDTNNVMGIENTEIKDAVEDALTMHLTLTEMGLRGQLADASQGIFDATGVRIVFGTDSAANVKAVVDAINGGMVTEVEVDAALEAAVATIDPFDNRGYLVFQAGIPGTSSTSYLTFEIPAAVIAVGGVDYRGWDFTPGVNYDRDFRGQGNVDATLLSTIEAAIGNDLEDAIKAVYNDGYTDGYADGYVDGFRDGYAAR